MQVLSWYGWFYNAFRLRPGGGCRPHTRQENPRPGVCMIYTSRLVSIPKISLSWPRNTTDLHISALDLDPSLVMMSYAACRERIEESAFERQDVLIVLIWHVLHPPPYVQKKMVIDRLRIISITELQSFIPLWNESGPMEQTVLMTTVLGKLPRTFCNILYIPCKYASL